MKCILCGNEEFECIHRGTRDVSNINVMKCSRCGMVQLDNYQYNTDCNYSEGGMLKNTYSVTSDEVGDIPWDIWLKETEQDDIRRYEALKETCRDKRVLEFGCGNGGFLRRIKEVAADVTGIELMDEARKRISQEGIKTFKTLSETYEKYDIICMFMVIEHLNNPDELLSKIYNVLVQGGVLIVETVNSDDALITKYSCNNFMDFTYWSEHVILFNSTTLETLINRNGFNTNYNTQIQRYSLANHLYWLAFGKPGGHMKWTEFNEKELNDAYEKRLVSLGIADTLWYIGTKK